MECVYSNKIATSLGVNSALAAGYLFCKEKKNGVYIDGKMWIKCSARKLSGVFPHMKIKAAENAFRRLVRNGVLTRYPYDKKSFDSTYYYSFTEYGNALMKGKE